MLGLQQLCDKLMNDALTDLTILGITISPTSQSLNGLVLI